MFRQGLRRLGAIQTRYIHAVAEGGCRDSVRLKGLVFHGYHGVLPEENVLGQKFIVDATIYSKALKSAGLSDDLQDTVDYAQIYDKIKRIVEGTPFKLIEALAENIAAEILQQEKVDSVKVRVQKPHVAVLGVVQSLGIEIYRDGR